jgi:hypothetical protein
LGTEAGLDGLVPQASSRGTELHRGQQGALGLPGRWRRGTVGKDPVAPRPLSEKEVLFSLHCVERENTGSLELSQPLPSGCLALFVFGGLFFFLFLWANCSH